MRKIQFNEETISQIRNYIESGHSVKETCNRFTLKYDTLRRVMFENNIVPTTSTSYMSSVDVDSEKVRLVCHLFKNTDAPMAQIAKESKLEYYKVLKILGDNFSEAEIANRESKLYRKSKLGSNNPAYGLQGEQTSQYKGGIVSDGQGYLMVKKPQWYTGRKGSDYVFYHSVVMCEALGLTEIPKGFVVHHIDMDPHNNLISNLALLDMGAHSKLHSMLNRCKAQRLSEQE